MTEDRFYFPHDYNPTGDPKMQAFISEYGATGYGVYWRIIEMLHQEELHYLPKKAYIYVAIAKQLLVEPSKVQKMIEDCILIYELFKDDDLLFWSERVFKNIEKRKEISTKRSEAGRKGAKARKEKEAIAKQP